jgi:hypothetical protein
VRLLHEPLVLPIQQEITLHLLTGPQLRHLVTAGSPNQRIAKAVA